MPFSKKKLVGATLLVVGLIASLIANEVGQHMADAGRPFLAMCLRGLKVLFELFVLAVATWIGMQPAPRTPLPGSPESLISSASASAATSASASASEKGQSAGVEGKENCVIVAAG
ncbi:hypothetical protein Pelo_19150 [Pelomyxa schiedti]|nr:hypothetical protein Pelo_19150 [Pelomyxa schiedti]